MTVKSITWEWVIQGEVVTARNSASAFEIRRPASGTTVHCDYAGTGKSFCGVPGAMNTTLVEVTCHDCLSGLATHYDWASAMLEILTAMGHFTPVRVAANGDGRYPHQCPRCRAAAYVGFSDIDCSAGCR